MGKELIMARMTIYTPAPSEQRRAVDVVVSESDKEVYIELCDGSGALLETVAMTAHEAVLVCDKLSGYLSKLKEQFEILGVR